MGKIAPEIQPLPGFALLEILENEGVKGWEIEDEKQLPQRGRVLAIGSGTYYEYSGKALECPVKVGDIIIHSSFGWERTIYKGMEYRFCPFQKILGVINEKA